MKERKGNRSIAMINSSSSRPASKRQDRKLEIKVELLQWPVRWPAVEVTSPRDVAHLIPSIFASSGLRLEIQPALVQDPKIQEWSAWEWDTWAQEFDHRG